MNLYITINYVILSVLFTFLLTEAMSVFSFMYDKRSIPTVKKYLDPVWGVVGTFAVFFIVNTEVLYPSIMPSIDYLYVFPILLATLLFIARNLFLVFSEYIWKDAKFNQLMLVRIYSLVTFLILLILISVFLSIISGIGANSTLTAFSVAGFLSNPAVPGFIAGAFLTVFGLSFAFYGLQKIKFLSPSFTLIGLLVFILSMRALNLTTNYITYILAAVIFALSVLYYLTGKARREMIFIAVFLSILSINLLNYGKVFGERALASYLNNSAVSSAALGVTAAGGALLTALLLFFLYMYRRPDNKEDYDENSNSGGNEISDKIGIANLYIMSNNNKEDGKEHKTRKNRKR